MATEDDSTPSPRVDDQRTDRDSTPHYRSPVLQIRPSPDATDHIRYNYQLAEAIAGMFHSSKIDLEAIELLAYPDRMGEETYLLAPQPRRYPATRNSGHKDILEYDSSAPAPEAQMLDSLRRQLTSHLGRTVEVLPVSVTFGNLGRSAAMTTRLAIQENERISPGVNLARNCFHELLARLGGEPHLHQVLISPKNEGEYNIVVRTALFRPTHQATTEAEAAAFVKNGRPQLPTRAYEPLGAEPAFDYLREPASGSGGRVRIHGSLDINHIARQTLRELLSGSHEYDRLIKGDRSFDDTYTAVDCYPKFVINRTDLEQFIGLPHVTYEDPWAQAPGRGPPRTTPITLDDVPQGSLESHHAPTPATDDAGGDDDPDSFHETTLEVVGNNLREAGYRVFTVDQGNDSAPDMYCLSPEGQLSIVELEFKNTTKSARLLTNVIRAHEWGLDLMLVWVAAADESTAPTDRVRAGISTLMEPFRQREDHRTLLYNREPLIVEDGPTPLLPADATQSKWWLYPDGTLKLVADGEVLATGEAGDSVATFEYDTPHAKQTTDGYVVTDESGDVIAEYDDHPVTADWTAIQTPLVPTRLSYLSYPEFKYLEGGELKEFIPEADWSMSDHEPRYKAALQDYFEMYTVPADDRKLFQPVVYEHAMRWYRPQSRYKTPNTEYFGRCRPKHLDTSDNTKPSKRLTSILRDWRYPPGLESPDLPDFSAGPEYPEEWADDIDHPIPQSDPLPVPEGSRPTGTGFTDIADLEPDDEETDNTADDADAGSAAASDDEEADTDDATDSE